jgi:hypothetical protein
MKKVYSSSFIVYRLSFIVMVALPSEALAKEGYWLLQRLNGLTAQRLNGSMAQWLYAFMPLRLYAFYTTFIFTASHFIIFFWK